MTEDLKATLEERGAVLRGHFALTSGRHSDTYIEKFRLLQWPDLTGPLCRSIAERFRGEVDAVAGPTTGGIILAYETARHLGIRALYAEERRAGPGREFRRDQRIAPGERILVVDDVLTTGGSIRDVLEAARDAGATPIGVGVLVDRSGGSVDFGAPLFACLEIAVQSWEPDGCPLCADGVPLTET